MRDEYLSRLTDKQLEALFQTEASEPAWIGDPKNGVELIHARYLDYPGSVYDGQHTHRVYKDEKGAETLVIDKMIGVYNDGYYTK